MFGLGNPEAQYKNTRHNVGFDVINKISNKYKIEVLKKKFNGLYGTGEIEGEKVILLKPQTYMNLSGDAIIQYRDFYKLDNQDIIIIYDDADLDVGDIRIKVKGSSGTHNGIKSVISRLKTEEFTRIRVGIGQPENGDLINYVIGKLSKEEKEVLSIGEDKATLAVESIIQYDVDYAMNEFN